MSLFSNRKSMFVALLGVSALLFGSAEASYGYGDESPAYGYGTTDKACDLGTIADIAIATPELSTLVSLVEAAGLVDAFTDPSSTLTVLAPTNKAFEALPTSVVNGLLADVDALTAVLTNHVLPVEVASTDLVDGASVAALSGKTITVDLSSGVTFQLEGGSSASVVIADIFACGGVIHVIDAVLA